MIDSILRPKTLGPMVATLAVMGLLAYDRFVLRVPVAEASVFHQRMQASQDLVPMAVGQWMGQDVPVPEAATRMLQPNLIVSRRYTNVITGESFSYLVVQVRDTRDILGHYPPVCYPGQGWQPVSSDPTDWPGGARPITGMVYQFGRPDRADRRILQVANFLVLPDGSVCRNMDEVESAAQDRLRKAFGAAQVQMVFGGDFTPERRREVTEVFVSASMPLLNELGSGVHQ